MYGSFVAHWADSHTEAEEAAEVAKGAKYITKSYGFYGATGATSSIAGTNMMHVVIKVRTDIETGHQDVIYQIPAALIPTVTYSITLNADSLEEATEFAITLKNVNGTLTLAGLSINGSNAAVVVATVTNTYNLSVDHTISGTKYLDNRSNKAMANNEFEFVLYETDEDFDIQGHTPLPGELLT